MKVLGFSCVVNNVLPGSNGGGGRGRTMFFFWRQANMCFLVCLGGKEYEYGYSAHPPGQDYGFNIKPNTLHLVINTFNIFA